MQDYEIAFLTTVLNVIKPRRVLEWGSGHSTIWFSNHMIQQSMEMEIWLSVEHDEAWARQMLEMDTPNPVQLLHIKPDHPRPKGFRKNHFRDYVQKPLEYGPFDLVIVDGRARNYCLSAAKSVVSLYGLVILHDANRLYYLPGMLTYPFSFSRKDWRPYEGGIWAGGLNKKTLSRIKEALSPSLGQAMNHLPAENHAFCFP